MQQSDLDLTMLFNVIRERGTTMPDQSARTSQGTGIIQRVRTLTSGQRRPVGRRSGQVGAPSSS